MFVVLFRLGFKSFKKFLQIKVFIINNKQKITPQKKKALEF